MNKEKKVKKTYLTHILDVLSVSPEDPMSWYILTDLIYDNWDDIKKFDLLIVDEAQDFLTEFFILGADNLIKNGLENGEWLICLDADYQANIHKKLNINTLIKRLVLVIPFTSIPTIIIIIN